MCKRKHHHAERTGGKQSRRTVFRYRSSALHDSSEKLCRYRACKDLLKSFFRSRTVALDEIMEQPAKVSPDHREVLEAVLSLPSKYRDVVYLYYYEEYTAPEIGRVLGRNVNTVYTLLTRSRKMLQEKLKGDDYE